MSALYNSEILRLATAIPHLGRLAAPQASVEKRSPVCGSRVIVDLTLDTQGRVAEFAQTVHSCALGQASAALFGAHVLGRTLAELEAAQAALVIYLSNVDEPLPDWPGLGLFAPARAHSARHAAILLPFAAAAEAACNAAFTLQHAP